MRGEAALGWRLQTLVYSLKRYQVSSTGGETLYLPAICRSSKGEGSLQFNGYLHEVQRRCFRRVQ